MLIKPSTVGYVRRQSDWPILISIRYLDASFLDELQSRYLIDAPRFSLRPEPGANEVAAPLATEGGRKLGYIIWKPELPGRRILNSLLPFAVSALSVLALLMLLLTRSLKQTFNERAAFEAWLDPGNFDETGRQRVSLSSLTGGLGEKRHSKLLLSNCHLYPNQG